MKYVYSVGYQKFYNDSMWESPMIQFETYKSKFKNKDLAMREYQEKYPSRHLYFFAKNS